jgi:hypothetical protein
MTPTHDERNRIILRRTLAAISHLYGAFSAFFGASLLAALPRGAGIHGSRTLGWVSLLHAALFFAVGTALWKPRKGATLAALAAALGSITLAVFDLAGNRLGSIATDGMYAVVALVILLLIRPRA